MKKNEKIEEIEELDTTEEVENEEEKKELEEARKERRKKKKIVRVVVNVILWIFFLIVILEAAIGIINMQRINNEEEPIWYLSKKITTNEKEEKTIYNLGLYKIVKSDTAKQTKTSLKPFFVGD